MCVDIIFDAKRPVSATYYKIAVYTGSQKAAGTDAKVKIRLHYGLKNSGDIKLYHAKADEFERGA